MSRSNLTISSSLDAGVRGVSVRRAGRIDQSRLAYVAGMQNVNANIPSVISFDQRAPGGRSVHDRGHPAGSRNAMVPARQDACRSGPCAVPNRRSDP